MSQPAPYTTSRIVNAPRALVYQCHTDVKHLERWMGPAGFDTIKADLDFRPGGTYHYGLRGPNGMEMWGKQVYREIVPNERIVLIQSFSDRDGGVCRHPMAPDWPLEMLSTITFEDAGPARTKVTVVWHPHDSDEKGHAAFDGARKSMDGGFAGTFNKLADYLSTLTGAIGVDMPSATDLVFTRVVNAPRALVWKAHTDRAAVQHWWGPEGFTITTHEMNVRPGGVWRLTMHGPDGTNYPNKLAYQEVVEPSVLEFDQGDFDQVLFHVRTEFHEEGARTRIVTRMTFPTQAQRDATATYAVPGHTSTMGRLDAYLARAAAA